MWLSWRVATERALYGDGGFFRGTQRPARHFRTSVLASSRFAAAVTTLLVEVDAALGHPDPLDFVDVGAGGGELVAAVCALAPDHLVPRLRAIAVELAARPPELPSRIGWADAVPHGVTGLVFANEWLDNVPVEVAEQAGDGPRRVLVDPETGSERLGGPLDKGDRAWLDRWWPLTAEGDRAEVGAPRDAAWAEAVGGVGAGLAVAVDYTHDRGCRPGGGTLAGYHEGRAVRPVPDGSCDITAHVALDACAVAGEAAGATATVLTTQREALRRLGLRARRPPRTLAVEDPARYLRELRLAGEEGELTDPAGVGGFGWLIQSVNLYPPAVFRATMGK
jgi:SAM-dependent MidA family methyltransferase